MRRIVEAVEEHTVPDGEDYPAGRPATGHNGDLMHSKVRPRTSPPPPAPRSTGPRRDVWLWLGLVILGAALAISFDRLTASNSSRTSATASAPPLTSSEPSVPESASASASEAPSESASPSETPPAAVLKAEMPSSVDGTSLTTESAVDTASLGNSPSVRALGAALTSLGKKPADLEIAYTYDPSGSLSLTIVGFRLPGVDPAKLRPLVLDAWLSSRTVGVTTSNVVLSGTPSTKVSYADSGPSEYLFVHKDSVFVIETTDQALAAKAASAIVSGVSGAGGSPGPSGSPGSSGSPSASGSPAPSGSPGPS